MFNMVGVILRRNRFLERSWSDRRKLRRRARQRPAGLEPSYHRQPPVAAGIRARDPAVLAIDDGIRADRNCKVELVADRDAVKPGRRDAHDRNRVTIERERLPDRRSGAAVSPLPEGIAQVHASRAAWLVVTRRNQPAEKWVHAKDGEEVTADPD